MQSFLNRGLFVRIRANGSFNKRNAMLCGELKTLLHETARYESPPGVNDCAEGYFRYCPLAAERFSRAMTRRVSITGNINHPDGSVIMILIITECMPIVPHL